MAARENGAWTVLKRNPNYRGRDPAKLDAIVLREGVDPQKAVDEVAHDHWHGVALDDAALHQVGTPAGGLARRATSYFPLPQARLDYIALDAGDVATESVLPPGVRGGSAVAPAVRRGAFNTHRLHLRMAVQSDCWQCSQFAQLVVAQLRPAGIDLTLVPLPDLAAALRDPHDRIDLAALSTELPYPDPASFLTQLLGKDVPSSWLPATTHRRLASLSRLRGVQRDRAAVQVGRDLGRDATVVAYGTPPMGMLLRRELGCKRWDRFDHELDLTALCLTRH
jgi:bacterioferritin-associated ferredoxin